MDLRAFRNIVCLCLLLGCWIDHRTFAFYKIPDNPIVPNEVKFANVTFQLNDVTKYLIQNEIKTIQANRQDY